MIALDLQRATSGPAAFREQVLIDCDGVIKPLAEVLQNWQKADFEALDAAWLQISGRAPKGHAVTTRRLWSERPRGSSKTTDIAIQAVWILLASLREVTGICVASDRDQARLLVDAIGKLVRLNGLAQILEVQRDRVINLHTGSTLTLMSSDAGSSYGQLCDFVIADEITHWPEGRGSAMWDSIVSTSAKKPSCVFVVITNAGYCGDWMFPIREAIRTDSRWRFSRLETPPEWIDAETLAEQARLLPPASYNRLWLNEWQSGAGDSINPAALRGCVTRQRPLLARPDCFLGAVLGLDIGVRRDHAAAVLLLIDSTGAAQPYLVAETLNWNPKDYGGEVPLAEVRDGILALRKQFNVPSLTVVADPWQAVSLCQELDRLGSEIIYREATAQNRAEEARTLLQIVNDRQIALYPGLLLEDLQRVRIVERPTTGLRLDWPRDNTQGHCDRGSALASCLPIASEYLRGALLGEWDAAYTSHVEFMRS